MALPFGCSYYWKMTIFPGAATIKKLRRTVAVTAVAVTVHGLLL